MSNKTAEEQYNDATESLRNVIEAEIPLIDQDADIQGLKGKARRKFVKDEREGLFSLARRDLVAALMNFSHLRLSSWVRISRASNGTGAAKEEAGTDLTSNAAVGIESAKALADSGEIPQGSGLVCPPDFVEMDGVCVRIRG